MQLYEDVKAVETQQHSSTLRIYIEEKSPAGDEWKDRAKRALDVVFSFIMLVFAAPILALAAIAVKLTSRGPVLYCQTRTGRGRKPYTMYKIRSMTHDCERTTGAQWAAPQDPRVTWVGRFLRRAHIDELPQL